ncbi:hypothetical protein L345_09517, partial [Ophiophagus hannah]
MPGYGKATPNGLGDVEGAFLGPSFEYSAQKLKVKEDGLYCIYAQIHVEPRGNPLKAMNATLYIHHNHESGPALLTITLHLPNHETKSYTNSISQIYRLSSNDILYGTLKGTTEADNDWALKISGIVVNTQAQLYGGDRLRHFHSSNSFNYDGLQRPLGMTPEYLTLKLPRK